MKEKQTQLCKDCVNFLVKETGLVDCDYECFLDVKLSDATIFVPLLFDCIEWEEPPR